MIWVLWMFVGLIGGYIVSSFVFLRYPVIGRSRSKMPRRLQTIQMIGHRGSVLEGRPENTIAAFKHAIAVGVEMIELDVMLTKDKKVIVFHDHTLDRMCQMTGNVQVNTFDFIDLPTLCPLDKNQTFESSRLCEANPSDTNLFKENFRIPLFEEVLQAIPPNFPLIVEFKENDLSLIEQVHHMLEESGRITKDTHSNNATDTRSINNDNNNSSSKNNSTIWYSLNPRANLALQAYDPTLATLSSGRDIVMCLLAHAVGLLPFVNYKFDAWVFFAMPITRSHIARGFSRWPTCFQNLIYAWIGEHKYVHLWFPKICHHLRLRGYPVWFVGLNSDVAVATVGGAEGTGGFTDKPAWLVQQQLHLKKPVM